MFVLAGKWALDFGFILFYSVIFGKKRAKNGQKYNSFKK
jgi:hypothetical protein